MNKDIERNRMDSSKNIGILTFHFSENYGAALQAYALRQWLIKNGHRVDFIPYHPVHVEDGGRMSIPKSREDVISNLKAVYLAISKINSKYLVNQDRFRRFSRFQKHHLGLSGSRLKIRSEVEEYSKTFTHLICGSDQIWSPSKQFGIDPVYFLDFRVARGVRKISYAPSFGSLEISENHWHTIEYAIKKLDSLSVREESAAKLIKCRTDLDPFVVPDPAILLGEYSDLLNSADDCRPDSSRGNHDGHIFSYCLRSSAGVSEVSQLVAQARNLRVLSPFNPHRRWREVGTTVYPGPSEWVRLLRESEFVVTNSFHGVVFSLIFNRDFVAFKLPGQKESISDRLVDLLKQVGLSERLVAPNDISRAQLACDTPINWVAVNLRLKEMQDVGAAWLTSQLQQ